jgi:hypothetical protein
MSNHLSSFGSGLRFSHLQVSLLNGGKVPAARAFLASSSFSSGKPGPRLQSWMGRRRSWMPGGDSPWATGLWRCSPWLVALLHCRSLCPLRALSQSLAVTCARGMPPPLP